jgi:phthalate 4,5-cis-dihydrodiol dehydrogenase
LASACERYGVAGFPNVEALCDSGLVDALFIGTPTDLHTEHALTAIEAGKHVVLAKPMALNLADGQRTIAAAEARGVHLIVGHSQSYEPAVKRMREIVVSGELGRLGMINSWYYTDWIYRGRKPSELQTELGGGVVYRQGAHHFDIARVLGGGLARSVRAMAGRWDQQRPTEGAYAAFLEFESGAAATLVFNGYDHFRTTELGFPIGEGGNEVRDEVYGQARAAIAARPADELALKKERRMRQPGERRQAFYGLTIVSCERGDIRQSPDGLLVYGDEGPREVPLPRGVTGRDLMLDELYQAVVSDTPALHDGRWGMATLELQLAVLESARERREVLLSHQVAYRG